MIYEIFIQITHAFILCGLSFLYILLHKIMYTYLSSYNNTIHTIITIFSFTICNTHLHSVEQGRIQCPYCFDYHNNIVTELLRDSLFQIFNYSNCLLEITWCYYWYKKLQPWTADKQFAKNFPAGALGLSVIE